MKQKKIVIGKSVVAIILVISILLAVQFATVVANKNNEIVGKIYFNKPVSWEKSYAYVCDEKGKELLGKWPGIELQTGIVQMEKLWDIQKNMPML